MLESLGTLSPHSPQVMGRFLAGRPASALTHLCLPSHLPWGPAWHTADTGGVYSESLGVTGRDPSVLQSGPVETGPPFPSPSQAVLDSTKAKVKANCTFLEGRGRCSGSMHDLWAQVPATCRLCERGRATQPLSAPVSRSVNGDIGTCL